MKYVVEYYGGSSPRYHFDDRKSYPPYRDLKDAVIKADELARSGYSVILCEVNEKVIARWNDV